MNVNIPKESIQTTVKVTREAGLLEFLYEACAGQSRNSVKSLLEQRRIMTAGRVITKFDYRLLPGDEVLILKKSAAADVTLRKMRLLYEDDQIVVIEKECGLLSVSTDKGTEETAFGILHQHIRTKNHNAQLFVVHRLDRETSGILMFAKTKDAQQALQNNWDEAVTKRIYYAVVEGCVKKAQGRIESWLNESKACRVYSSKTPGDGQRAVTNYRLLRGSPRYSLLEVSLDTGRKNQIRVHMQDMGHSVAGDKKYGAKTDPIHRLALHAGVLEFIHPAAGNIMHFETEIPAAFEKIFSRG